MRFTITAHIQMGTQTNVRIRFVCVQFRTLIVRGGVEMNVLSRLDSTRYEYFYQSSTGQPSNASHRRRVSISTFHRI